jgi:glutamate dehydrogenase (NAD(P)+)
MYVLEHALHDMEMSFEGLKVALQGFGNVGSHAAKLIAQRGGKIVAVGDHKGGIFNNDGLEVSELISWADTNRTVKGFPGGDPMSTSEEVLTWDCDVLIPAALGGVLTKENAADVRARIIAEGANGPTTPEADEILHKREILVLPDILANAGGVTVSYFEWAQNIQQFKWSLDKINSELADIMQKAYTDIRAVAKKKNIDMRTAAFVLGIGRVAKATITRSYVSNDKFEQF